MRFWRLFFVTQVFWKYVRNDLQIWIPQFLLMMQYYKTTWNIYHFAWYRYQNKIDRYLQSCVEMRLRVGNESIRLLLLLFWKNNKYFDITILHHLKTIDRMCAFVHYSLQSNVESNEYQSKSHVLLKGILVFGYFMVILIYLSSSNDF